MSGLDQFFKSRVGARLIGTYFYPLYHFGSPDPNEPYGATEVITHLNVGSHVILMTRMSGLFVLPPANLSNPYVGTPDAAPADDLEAKLLFENEAAEAFNRVICEFCLSGVVSQPTSPVHISYAQLFDGHALITGGSGGREFYGERSVRPAGDLLNHHWLSWPLRGEDVVHQATSLSRASRLADISHSIPEFVAGAYSLYSQRQASEALVDSWVVCEQLLNYLWDRFCERLDNSPRRRRLKDARSVNLRLEVLQTAGSIPESLAEALHAARRRRNRLMHHASTGIEAARKGLEAMKMALEHVLGEEVAEPSVSTGVNW